MNQVSAISPQLLNPSGHRGELEKGNWAEITEWKMVGSSSQSLPQNPKNPVLGILMVLHLDGRRTVVLECKWAVHPELGEYSEAEGEILIVGRGCSRCWNWSPECGEISIQNQGLSACIFLTPFKLTGFTANLFCDCITYKASEIKVVGH